MTTETLVIQLRSLEAQLTILRAHLMRAQPVRKSLAAFYGALAGIAETTEKEIESAELKIKAEWA